jgi:hypothetical protein
LKVKTLLGQIADGLKHNRAGAADKRGIDYALSSVKAVSEIIGEFELPALDAELAMGGGDRLTALITALRREHKRLKEYNLGWGADMLHSVQRELARGAVQKAAAGETLEGRVKRLADAAARKVVGR